MISSVEMNQGGARKKVEADTDSVGELNSVFITPYKTFTYSLYLNH